MERSDVEESNAKCHVCGRGLLYIEHMLFGNRCIFCTEQELPQLNVFMVVARAVCDFLIYRQALRIGRVLGGEEGKYYFQACLGTLGFIDVNQVKTVKNKIRLITELRKGKKNAEVSSIAANRTAE